MDRRIGDRKVSERRSSSSKDIQNDRSKYYDYEKAMALLRRNKKKNNNNNAMMKQQSDYPFSSFRDKRTSDNDQKLNESLDLLQLARKEQSLSLYTQGLEDLLQCLKRSATTTTNHMNSDTQNGLRELARVYMSEAEQLKQQQQQQQKHDGNDSAVFDSIPSHLDSNLVHQILSDFVISSSTTSTVSGGVRRGKQKDHSWDNDIAGLKNVKMSLQESVLLPLQRPDLFANHNLRRPPKGVLLYGPPGTGKTMLVKAIAAATSSSKDSRTKLNTILFQCSPSIMLSKYMGEGEKLIKTLFALANHHAQNKNCSSIVFCDEMDALLSRRSSDGNEHEASRRFKTEWMVQMDNAATNVIVMGCTNCPWDLDDAILRRMNRRIYVPLPDSQSRLALWKKLLSQEPNILSNKNNLSTLVKLSNQYSCADITNMAQEAAMTPVRELFQEQRRNKSINSDQAVRPMKLSDITNVMSKTKPSVSNVTLQRFQKWEQSQT